MPSTGGGQRERRMRAETIAGADARVDCRCKCVKVDGRRRCGWGVDVDVGAV